MSYKEFYIYPRANPYGIKKGRWPLDADYYRHTESDIRVIEYAAIEDLKKEVLELKKCLDASQEGLFHYKAESAMIEKNSGDAVSRILSEYRKGLAERDRYHSALENIIEQVKWYINKDEVTAFTICKNIAHTALYSPSETKRGDE